MLVRKSKYRKLEQELADERARHHDELRNLGQYAREADERARETLVRTLARTSAPEGSQTIGSFSPFSVVLANGQRSIIPADHAVIRQVIMRLGQAFLEDSADDNALARKMLGIDELPEGGVITAPADEDGIVHGLSALQGNHQLPAGEA